MKNKVELKKVIKKILIIIVILFIITLFLNIYEYHVYTVNFNNKVNGIIDIVHKEYPNIKEEQIIEILNSKGKEKSEVLSKYGFSLNDKAIILENNKDHVIFILINSIILIIGIVLILLQFIIYLKKREKEIIDITEYIKELNKRNYSLKIKSNTEDELSILKNEIYKTTVMLKETADIAREAKVNLKVSLEDISHQLKTPLTSILIMLDNLIDDRDMDQVTRDDFIQDIKRNVVNINFLLQSILKLSKFDANTIHFIKKETYIKDIMDEVNKNLSTLCDLKNIKLNIKGDNKIKIICDYRWEVEALTNIIKNCIEYSSINDIIEIKYEEYNVYTLIAIKDYGKGISKKDLPHIFERFYKGEQSSSDSIGIGLALAKVIIENDNGLINVESSNKGTSFIIKYFK